jgi:hypothetical protein
MFYKIDKSYGWNNNPLIKDISGILGIVFRVEKGKKIKIIWYNRKKTKWFYFLTAKKYKEELDFWVSNLGYSFSKCTKKEAEEMLGYKI